MIGFIKVEKSFVELDQTRIHPSMHEAVKIFCS